MLLKWGIIPYFNSYHPRVTTKKIAVEYIQKEMRKLFKHFCTKKIKFKDKTKENEDKKL
jgi:hypothetical protein